MVETKFENVSKFTANTGRIKNWRVSTVGQYIYHLSEWIKLGQKYVARRLSYKPYCLIDSHVELYQSSRQRLRYFRSL